MESARVAAGEMMRRALLAVFAALLVWTAPAWPHNTGAREDHQVEITLARDHLRVDYDITVNQPGRTRTMSDGQYRMFQTRSAARVARLLTIAIDGRELSLTTAAAEKTPTFEKYRFDAPLDLSDGLHAIEVFDMNMAYQASGAVTFRTDGDVRLPRAIEEEPLRGPLLFNFGVGVTPPAQEIFQGRLDRRTARVAAPPVPGRRWRWAAAGALLLVCGAGVGLLLVRRRKRTRIR